MHALSPGCIQHTVLQLQACAYQRRRRDVSEPIHQMLQLNVIQRFPHLVVVFSVVAYLLAIAAFTCCRRPADLAMHIKRDDSSSLQANSEVQHQVPMMASQSQETDKLATKPILHCVQSVCSCCMMLRMLWH